MSIQKSAAYFAALLGLVAIAILTQRQGFGDIVDLFRRAGWPLLVLVPFHILPLLLDTAGWRALVKPRDATGRAGLAYLFWASTIREAVARLLPLASVGGELIGIRLVMLRGLDGAAATAGIVVQLLLSIVNQLLFAMLGLGLLLLRPDSGLLAHRLAIGVLLSAPLPPLLLLLLRHGRVFERAQRLLATVAGAGLQNKLGLDGAALDAGVGDLLRRRGALLAATSWELSGLVVGAFENWIALRLLGHPVDLLTALSLEAATQASRHLFFMMPAGLGVQEAGLVLVGPLLGVPADLAIALSLCKRMRDLLFGLPALLSWQWLEAAHRRSA